MLSSWATRTVKRPDRFGVASKQLACARFCAASGRALRMCIFRGALIPMAMGLALGCEKSDLSGPRNAAPPEGWNGLATRTRSYCGVDRAIVALWASYRVWYESPEGVGKELVADGRGDFLAQVGRLPQKRPCVACLSADVALRRFTPLAFDAAGRSDLAQNLRRWAPIRTSSDARIAHEKAAALLNQLPRDESETDAFASARASLDVAVESAERAANDQDVQADDVMHGDQWCVVFEGMSEYDDTTMKTLEYAVAAGIPKQRAIEEARSLLRRLVRFARGQGAD